MSAPTRRYLLVDDNVAFAENLSEILEDSGAEVVTVANGADALELVRTKRFDAVVTDMRMPVMSGARLVHEIRSVDRGLAAVVVTAFTADDDLIAARQEGLLAVLPKPVPIDRLMRLLASARRDALVAIVEDDLALSDNLTELLHDKGFSVVTAASVAETERLGPVRPFMALVDLRVPHGPSGEAMRKLTSRFPDLPTIVITAFPEDPGPLDHRRVFLKPFDTGALLGAVERTYASARAT